MLCIFCKKKSHYFLNAPRIFNSEGVNKLDWPDEANLRMGYTPLAPMARTDMQHDNNNVVAGAMRLEVRAQAECQNYGYMDFWKNEKPCTNMSNLQTTIN